jgi:hypothetical protein
LPVWAEENKKDPVLETTGDDEVRSDAYRILRREEFLGKTQLKPSKDEMRYV